jgi:uncharacterized BrkB/YihY/UPF0761 family membrane protein
MKKEETKLSSNNFGIASVILGILSIVLSLIIFIGLIIGALGLIFGLIQRKKSKNKWSLWGIILSVIGIIIGILFIWAIFSWISSTQQIVQQCIANPAGPGCEEILKLIPQDQLNNLQYGQ